MMRQLAVEVEEFLSRAPGAHVEEADAPDDAHLETQAAASAEVHVEEEARTMEGPLEAWEKMALADEEVHEEARARVQARAGEEGTQLRDWTVEEVMAWFPKAFAEQALRVRMEKIVQAEVEVQAQLAAEESDEADDAEVDGVGATNEEVPIGCPIRRDDLVRRSDGGSGYDEVEATPCAHVFHAECLGLWLNRRNTCPECRRPVRADDGDREEDEESIDDDEYEDDEEDIEEMVTVFREEHGPR